jgi:protein phosphatase
MKQPTVPQFILEGHVISDTGMLRSSNEDNYLLDGAILADPYVSRLRWTAASAVRRGGWYVAAVFDGMGGGEKGELASLAAAEVFRRMEPPGLAEKEEMDRLLHSCFQEANKKVLELRNRFGVCGTTATVVCSNGAEFKIYHLGDSRAYLFRDEELFQLTKDHTLAQMKRDMGIYDAHVRHSQEEHHVLTRYIGGDMPWERIRPVESQWIPVQENVRLLLCSDGLYDMCHEGRILAVMQQISSPKDAARLLVDTAMTCGGVDNITCLIISFTMEETL